MRLFYRNDGYVIVDRLTDLATGLPVNDATLTLSLRDQQRNLVTDADAISMAYQTGSDGTYLGLVPYTVQTTVGTVVYATIVSSNYPGVRFEDVPIDIVKRTGVA